MTRTRITVRMGTCARICTEYGLNVARDVRKKKPCAITKRVMFTSDRGPTAKEERQYHGLHRFVPWSQTIKHCCFTVAKPRIYTITFAYFFFLYFRRRRLPFIH